MVTFAPLAVYEIEGNLYLCCYLQVQDSLEAVTKRERRRNNELK